MGKGQGRLYFKVSESRPVKQVNQGKLSVQRVFKNLRCYPKPTLMFTLYLKLCNQLKKILVDTFFRNYLWEEGYIYSHGGDKIGDDKIVYVYIKIRATKPNELLS